MVKGRAAVAQATHATPSHWLVFSGVIFLLTLQHPPSEPRGRGLRQCFHPPCLKAGLGGAYQLVLLHDGVQTWCEGIAESILAILGRGQ